MKWVHFSPEEGLYLDDGFAEAVSSTGMTLAEEFPESYWQVANWKAAILLIAEAFHRWACGLCRRPSSGGPK